MRKRNQHPSCVYLSCLYLSSLYLACLTITTTTTTSISHTSLGGSFRPAGAQLVLGCAPGSTNKRHLCSREHHSCLIVLPEAQQAYLQQACLCFHKHNKRNVCPQEHNQARFVLQGAQVSDVCAPASKIKHELCPREHTQAFFVLPRTQAGGRALRRAR